MSEFWVFPIYVVRIKGSDPMGIGTAEVRLNLAQATAIPEAKAGAPQTLASYTRLGTLVTGQPIAGPASLASRVRQVFRVSHDGPVATGPFTVAT